MARTWYSLLPAIAVTTWASNIVAGRYLVGKGFIDGVTLSLARFLIATPALALLLAPRGLRPPGRDIHLLAAAGLLGVTIFNTALYSSLAYISAAAASFIASLATPATYAIAVAIGRDKPSPRLASGILLSILGVYILLRGGIKVWGATGVILALSAALAWSLYTVIVDSLKSRYTPEETLLWSMAAGTIGLAPLGYQGLHNAVDSTATLAIILYVAIVPGLLGYLLWNIGVKNLGPSLPSIFIPLIPLLTTIMETILLKTRPTQETIIGGALIITGIIIIITRR